MYQAIKNIILLSRLVYFPRNKIHEQPTHITKNPITTTIFLHANMINMFCFCLHLQGPIILNTIVTNCLLQNKWTQHLKMEEVHAAALVGQMAPNTAQFSIFANVT